MTCSSAGWLKVWNLESRKQIGKDWRDGKREVSTIALSPDEKKVVSVSNDDVVKLWDIGKQINVLIGHASYVKDIAISPNGLILASSSLDQTALLWGLENCQPISAPLQYAHAVTCVSFSTDGKLLATVCWDKSAYTWDVSAIIRDAGHTEWVKATIYLPGGQRIMTCSKDGSLRVWDLDSEKHIREDWREENSDVHTIALSPDGNKVVNGSYDVVKLWDIDIGQVITKWTGRRCGVTSVCWSREW
ncbi:WD40 repeat-like protein [Rhizopogon vinicolor AM-OR11-026]|uniref:WD40 repeat-like protein n=1 Tax=Rhizopogon vinicolor AM-OR11-026 TaxID=1314800 RepID=A0A1B7N1D1_9AGAM|nr:WD40 repeat-like protein [Rhizopogon vinicolor AM-OR11-026]